MSTVAARIVRTASRTLLAFSALLGVLCLGGAAAAVVTGGQAVVVRSGSMAPALPIGSLAVLHPVPATALGIGDAASVLVRPGERVTHRIVAVDRPAAGIVRLHLRGDANAVVDPEPVDVGAGGQVQVVAFAVPYAGRVVAWLQTPGGRLALLGYLGVLLIVLGRRPEQPGIGRSRGRHVVRGAAATAAVGVVLTSGGAAEAAAWTDPVAVTGTSLAPVTPTAPTVNCPGSLGVGAITFTWPAVPNATSYTVNYGSSGSQSTVTTSTSITLNGLISGGKFSVRTNYNAWQSAASSPVRTYTVTLALISTCS